MPIPVAGAGEEMGSRGRRLCYNPGIKSRIGRFAMTAARLDVSKVARGYRIVFKTDAGKVICEVSGRPGSAGGAQGKREDALHRAKMLARAFHEAIVVG
jgi:hypothetical protein